MTTEESGGTKTTGRKVAGAVALLLLLALVAPFVVYAIPQLVGADASYVVVSGSMEPQINTGDVVIVAATPARQITTGDVITFTRGDANAPVTHRVVDVTQTGDGARAFVTKGDANEEADGAAVPAANVVGRVVLTIPYIGHVITLGGTELGFVLLVAVPIALFILNEAWTLFRSEDEKSDRDAADGEAGIVADATEGEAAFEFTRTDLNLTLVALAGAAVYAAYMSYLLLDAAAVMGLVAAIGAFVLVAAIRYASPPGEPVLDRTDAGVALSLKNRIVEGTVPHAIRDRPRVPVNSLPDLVSMARAVDGWIIADDEEFFLVTDDLVYTCEAVVVRHDAESVDDEMTVPDRDDENPLGRRERADNTGRSDPVAVDGGREEDDDAE